MENCSMESQLSEQENEWLLCIAGKRRPSKQDKPRAEPDEGIVELMHA